MEIDYPLFTETILEHDREPFNMKKFQKHYTSFLLELREQHLLSQNIITSITHYNLRRSTCLIKSSFVKSSFML